MSKLINDLIHKGYLKSDIIIDAFSEINRIEFLPKDFETQAEADVALPIGFGQMISQPTTVAFMLELLEPKRGQKILDVGSGSGWTTALLSYIVGKNGRVIGIERIDKLLEFGKENVDKFGYIKNRTAEMIFGDGSSGVPKEAPFDRILVSAEAESVPEELKRQLKIGGKMVIPLKNNVWYLEKKGENEFYKEEFPGFAFVPLVIG